MKSKLSKWQGQFLVDHKIVDSLDAVELKQGDTFKIRLLAKRERRDEKEKRN